MCIFMRFKQLLNFRANIKSNCIFFFLSVPKFSIERWKNYIWISLSIYFILNLQAYMRGHSSSMIYGSRYVLHKFSKWFLIISRLEKDWKSYFCCPSLFCRFFHFFNLWRIIYNLPSCSFISVPHIFMFLIRKIQHCLIWHEPCGDI